MRMPLTRSSLSRRIAADMRAARSLRVKAWWPKSHRWTLGLSAPDMGMGGMAGMNMAGIDGMKGKDMPAMPQNGTTQNGMKGIGGMDVGNSSMHSMPAMNKGKPLGADRHSLAGIDMRGSSKEA